MQPRRRYLCPHLLGNGVYMNLKEKLEVYGVDYNTADIMVIPKVLPLPFAEGFERRRVRPSSREIIAAIKILRRGRVEPRLGVIAFTPGRGFETPTLFEAIKFIVHEKTR